MKIKCIKCGYEIEILENEMEGEEMCELCGEEMHSQAYIDFINKKPQEKEEIHNETARISEAIYEQMLNKMINDIETKGEDKMWEIITETGFSHRIMLIEVFFEAKWRIENGR